MPSTFTQQSLLSQSVNWGASSQDKGEVFTNPDVIDFMLITSGISAELLYEHTKILEPSCGQGAFVVAIANQLIQKLKSGYAKPSLKQVKELVVAFDISERNILEAKSQTRQVLLEIYEENIALEIVNAWFHCNDFLLAEINHTFSHVIGNPPYIRIESIPEVLLAAYRSRFFTMKDRADIYIAFFEKSLKLLNNHGRLTFICTDRWTKNKYGTALRQFISEHYHLDLYVDLYGFDAFQSEVMTYPAITQLSTLKKNKTVIVHSPEINELFSQEVYQALVDSKNTFEGEIVRKDLIRGGAPWIFGSGDELELMRRLESQYPLIEKAGCSVHIGAATGNNSVFIVDSNVEIESCRKLPVVTAQDIKSNKLKPSGKFIINTYDADGLIDLNHYPLLKTYLFAHKEKLEERHVSKLNPNHWYKTIDRVHPERAFAEKILIPDIKTELTAVYDSGIYHPNNSIYFICSTSWNILALQGLLLSGIGQLFVELYSTKISGGHLRFQAQHLRRIRIPFWDSLSQEIQSDLVKAATDNDVFLAKTIAAEIYNMNEKERQIIGL